jgi:hypothetical protein
MKTFRLLLILTVASFGCQSSTESNYAPKSTLLGQWCFVGQFSHLADYKCLICPNFDPDKSIYKLNFNIDGTFDAKINLLIGKGNYQNKEQQNNYNPQIYKDLFTANGSFGISNLSFLNKPPQTNQDTEFIKNLESCTLFYQTTHSASQPYDELSMTFDRDNFLFFVRKR